MNKVKTKELWLLLMPSLALLILGLVLWGRPVSTPKSALHSFSLSSLALKDYVTWAVVIFGWCFQCALWGLLIAFGIWLYRRVPVRSLPWLMAYLLLSILIGICMPFVMKQIISKPTAPLGWSKGELVVQWSYGSHAIGVAIDFMILLLLLSDLTFLLQRMGVELDRELIRRLVKVRDHSTLLGIIIICLQLVVPFVAVVLSII